MIPWLFVGFMWILLSLAAIFFITAILHIPGISKDSIRRESLGEVFKFTTTGCASLSLAGFVLILSSDEQSLGGVFYLSLFVVVISTVIFHKLHKKLR